MNLQRFMNWCDTANSRERIEGFAAIAHAIMDETVPPFEAEAAEAALMMALDDPSPKVRASLAAEVARHHRAPVAFVRALLQDCEEVAVVVAASPVLVTDDLLDVLALPYEAVHEAVAGRADLGPRVVATIATDGSARAAAALLNNPHLVLSEAVLRVLAERHGGVGSVRALLVSRALPANIRQTLILETAHSLGESSLVQAVLGPTARRVVFEACERATSGLAEEAAPREVPALVEHLRGSGQLSVAFLLRAACLGNIDLLAASLTALSGLSERRVRAVLVECRDAPFRTLGRHCGLTVSEGELIRLATRCWKDIATGHVEPNGGEAAETVLRRVARAFGERMSGAEDREAFALLRRLQRENAREVMRRRTERLLAA